MKQNQRLLNLAVRAGEILLANGAEIYRVQETIQRILTSFGFIEYDIYVLANGIFTTLDEEGDQCVAVRSVPVSTVHLGRIAAVNSLSREIVRSKGQCDVDEMENRLNACATIPRMPQWKMAVAGAACSAGYCFLLSGHLLDCLPAATAGFLLSYFLFLFHKNKTAPYIGTILGAALVTLVCCGFWVLGVGIGLDRMITGSIITLVPGIVLTTSIRDFFHGDYLSGCIHLFNALVQAACIALGVVVAMQAISFLGVSL